VGEHRLAEAAARQRWARPAVGSSAPRVATNGALGPKLTDRCMFTLSVPGRWKTCRMQMGARRDAWNVEE
jgi:hypothetical protein